MRFLSYFLLDIGLGIRQEVENISNKANQDRKNNPSKVTTRSSSSELGESILGGVQIYK